MVVTDAMVIAACKAWHRSPARMFDSNSGEENRMRDAVEAALAQQEGIGLLEPSSLVNGELAGSTPAPLIKRSPVSQGPFGPPPPGSTHPWCRQAQPETPTREMIAKALYTKDDAWESGYTEDRYLAMADSIMALFAPKETA